MKYSFVCIITICYISATIKVMKLPISPFNTRQEQYREDPWKMLIVCFMLNQTNHKQVDLVREQFFQKFPNAQALALSPENEISEIIKPLGFYNRRAKAWRIFSLQWLDAIDKYGTDKIPVHGLEKMKGVGKYALDSWKVFQLYEYDTKVDDHVLNWYVDWAKKEVERISRETKPWKPMTVFYAHTIDERWFLNNWKARPDYAACVMARTIDEAIEKVEKIALNQEGAFNIKVLGIGHGKEEWVDEEKPMTTDFEFYRKQTEAMFNRIQARQK